MTAGGIFGDLFVSFAREAARGVIEGILRRYSIRDLQWHIDRNTNLVQEGLRSPDPRDHDTIELARKMAIKYRRYAPKIREAVTTEWFLSPERWLWKKYPDYARLINTPRGRVWLDRNLKYALDFFFSPS